MQTYLIDRPGSEEEARKLGLLDGEFSLIVEKLGRNPTFTEVAMFSGMWSEHCSYKNSILLLKKLYSKSDRLLAKPGEENAGALRINDTQAVVFKIESHNHPSAIEPYQGAATGVGGIMRDIFTMGARPLVTLNSLRFGPPTIERNKWLLSQVVKGIGDYGNSLGIPCAGGEVWFHESYTRNPLVNAMTVGIAPIKLLASAHAKGVGNLVVYFGAKTGRDGIHGASFASKDLSDESAEERSAVQVGDPFMEKLLMEATIECIEKGLVIAIQDMGAAGLLSSSSEMAASGSVGIDLFLEKVPARETQMQPFEYLLSESQERMLAICTPEKLSEIQNVFEKWDLHAEVIGQVTDTEHLRVFQDGELFADVPATALAKMAPRYEREIQKPANTKTNGIVPKELANALKRGAQQVTELLQRVVSHPNLASKAPIYEQYDTDIGLARLIGPGQNAGVYRIPDSQSALSVSTDGNSFYVSLDPYDGARLTVAECIRNLVSSGATPLGITNCLNFANPYKPENYYFFRRAVEGMSDCAEFFEVPVTGGNVSFYNESQDGPVLPTPTIGMVGLIEDADKTLPARILPGETAFLIGRFEPALECSQYTYILQGSFGGSLPAFYPEDEKRSMQTVLQLCNEKIIVAANDVANGGWMYSLLKLIFAGRALQPGTGFKIEERPQFDADLAYFGESAHCYIAVSSNANAAKVRELCTNSGVPCLQLGKATTDAALVLPTEDGSTRLDITGIENAWQNGLVKFFSE